VYVLCRDAYKGRASLSDFDRAIWMYSVEPFIMGQKEAEIHSQTMSGFLELLLCAVGSPPVNRRFLTVSQKDCCLGIRRQVWETWYDKLHHLPPRIDEAVAAMARYKLMEVRAARAAAGLPPDPPSPPTPLVHPIASVPPPAFTPGSESPPPMIEPEDDVAPSNEPEGAARGEVELPSKELEQQTEPQEVANDAMDSQSISKEEATWETIEILFLSDERVQIRTGTNRETLNYAEFGFDDGRNGTPNQAWQVFRALAEQNGVIADGRALNLVWPKVEKRMQEIRKVLREHFGISADPIPFVENGGYRAQFKIGCSPSFHT
jgi:hypothetical protein